MEAGRITLKMEQDVYKRQECDPEKTGTKVTFLPDDTIFEETVFEYDILKQRFREMAFLTAGLKIVLRDERCV